jgi:Reverse transcriptase (RNA-dependent DNA polymerase)
LSINEIWAFQNPTLLSIAISKGWSLRQLDINNTFLHKDLNETVYMTQPPGYVNSDLPHHVCRLKKALYGLKQAPRAWFHRLREFLLAHGFVSSQSDSSLFISTTHGETMYLLVYVDDIIVTGTSQSFITRLFTDLHNTFTIKDLGNLSFFLGIETTHLPTGLHLSQTRYIDDLLIRARMSDAKPVVTPMQYGLQLTKDGSDPMADPTMYRSVVGALQYVTITRPKITFVVHRASLFMHSSTEQHWTTVKHILQYLKEQLIMASYCVNIPTSLFKSSLMLTGQTILMTDDLLQVTVSF